MAPEEYGIGMFVKQVDHLVGVADSSRSDIMKRIMGDYQDRDVIGSRVEEGLKLSNILIREGAGPICSVSAHSVYDIVTFVSRFTDTDESGDLFELFNTPAYLLIMVAGGVDASVFTDS